jgi:hypothetical protein
MKSYLKPERFIFTLFLLFALLASQAQKTVKIRFNSNNEVSGQKFAIRDISPGLPAYWDDYNFVVIEFRISTPQRFHIGFTTDWGYNELRVMSYTPKGWNKLAIPLKFYRQLPGAALDLAATYNQPRYTGWINLGGKRGPLHAVDSIGIRMHAPIGNPTFELHSISLSVEDPGDQYLGKTPVVNEFGQWNTGKYEGKVKSISQLKKEWASEDKEDATATPYNYSKFGGYLQVRQKATGFFRTEKIDGRWWFVDPEGYLFLSVGVDCVSPGGGGNVRDLEKRKNLFEALPPANLASNSVRPGSVSFGNWNLFRRYGNDYPAKSKENIIRRMDRWGINTIGNWSGMDVINMNRKAFMLQLRGIGIEGGLMGLPDVYVPGFVEKIDAACKTSVEPFKENPWLIGYFTGNEPSWLEQEERLCQMILDGDDKPIKKELLAWLASGDTPAKRKQFIFDTFRIFLKTVDNAITKYDPNHLNLGIRFGNVSGIDRQILEICKEVFDVLSFNCYALFPKKEMMDRAMEITGLPMIIGEYHFGTVDRGMAQSLWQVNNQQERGVAYRYYTERAYSHPGLIGTAWFQWCDQDLTGRRDGENYNCGFVDVTDRPYKYLVEAVSETSKRLLDVHRGTLIPIETMPVKARGHGGFPDIWK